MHPIDILVSRYPALALPIQKGMKESEEYRAVCLRGLSTERIPQFNKTKEDRLETVETPAGTVEILYLANREDFIHAYRALAYRCEPADIPASIGAVTLLGLNNWEKIRLLTVPVSEADKSDYKDILILLSKGAYSNLSYEKTGCDEVTWLEKSYLIRKYHELTHFISRSLYIENKEAIRDEIMADMIGLLFAFGEYPISLAKMLLGIEGTTYQEGGRLQNYLSEHDRIEDVVHRSVKTIHTFFENLPKDANVNPFSVLELFEKQGIGVFK